MISARAHRRLERRPAGVRAVRPVLEAILALVVFVGGFEVGPTLHQIAHASLDAHVHEGEVVGARHRARSTAEAAHDALTRDDARRSHGHDSVAHRGVLFLGAAPPTPLVPFAGLVGRLDGERTRPRPERRHAIVHVARGPPTSVGHQPPPRPRA